MCTVSFYKNQQRTIITSNRDEHIDRPLAIAPQKRLHNETILYCPIDPKSQGTWFGVTNHKHVFVLLNGADTKHISKSSYIKSRGLILLDILSAPNWKHIWQEINLLSVEPFTIIAFEQDSLAQLRWNGKVKSQLELDTNVSHIWSSATLYDEAVIQKRKDWFAEFLKNRALSGDDLIDFHTNTQKKDAQNGLIINRNQTMLTKNVTQCVIENNGFTLTHYDLITNEKTFVTD